MAERQALPLPFGRGLDRESGLMVIDPSAFADIRNVHLQNGRAELRKGLALALELAGESAILGVFSIRSQGLGAAITYNESTREVKLWQLSGAGDEASLVGVLWTLDISAAFPRVIAADSYDKLFIAHEEVSFSKRGTTRVFDPSTGGITDLTADLDRSGVAEPIKFRGVARHLNYLMGWGMGVGTAIADADRPEILRVSLPADPSTFQPEHYFIIGQRGDPIIAGAPAGNVFAARKASESYDIFGTDRSNFGFRPADPLYGCAAGRLSITVGTTNYFWSLEGPRRSQGGETQDLSLPLDLGGPSPDVLATTGQVDYGFACYLPTRKEVLFVFGKWAYVLSLRDPANPEWTFRQFQTELASGGILYDTGGSGVLGPTAYGDFVSVTNLDPAASPVPGDVTYDIIGTLAGGEQVEIWHRPKSLGLPWERKLNGDAVVGVQQTKNITGFLPGTEAEVAIRFKKSGIFGAGYTSSDPASWPAVSRGTVLVPYAAPEFAIAYERTSATTADLLFTLTPTDGDTSSHTFYRIEISENGGMDWTELTTTQFANTSNLFPTLRVAITPHIGLQRSFRMRRESNLVTGPWSATVDRFVGPAAPANVQVFSACVVGESGIVQLVVDWENNASGVLRLRVDLDGGGGTSGFYFHESTHTAPPADQAIFNVALADNEPIDVAVRHEVTAFGVTDVSPFTVKDHTVPACS